ncbi:MAG: hypothetical protein HKM89_13805 [Gemmatimonadales bacterium]|nr:hypothetical protein [Gemmatimonadales bacterium]
MVGRGTILGVLGVLMAACGTPQRQDSGSESVEGRVIRPAGLAFPYVKRPACPGEGCAYGTWLACDTVSVYAREADTTERAFYLAREEPFQVLAGAVHVTRPEVVVVTRPTHQIGFQESGVLFQQGDTLFVLDYIAEGFFDAWYRDSIIETEIFWPWEHWYPAKDYEYGGDVVQQGVASFWIQVRNGSGQEGWVPADRASLASANSLDPDPPRCPARAE